LWPPRPWRLSSRRRRNADIPEGQRIEFRIGINLGDIMVEEGDIYGDGVNVAARLENIAEPGTVYISRTVRDFVDGTPEILLEDLGERELKSIAKPVHVFRIAAPERAATAPQPAAPAVPHKPSIAVLPFTNMSGDAEQEYFSDGMTEDLITDLSKISALFVIARNSSFAYKGRAVKVQEIGRDLGVRFMLEGSIRKSGNRARITSQLIDAESGGHVWAERSDRDLTDIFATQEEVVEKIVRSR
jgi:adenylate cyclase